MVQNVLPQTHWRTTLVKLSIPASKDPKSDTNNPAPDSPPKISQNLALNATHSIVSKPSC
jgi:hypothetical protein